MTKKRRKGTNEKTTSKTHALDDEELKGIVGGQDNQGSNDNNNEDVTIEFTVTVHGPAF